MNPYLQMHSVLSHSETALADRIQQFLKAKNFSRRIIYKTHPSTFIKPEWLENPSDESLMTLFQGIILFSLVRGSENSYIDAAIIDANTPNAELVASLLTPFDIRVFLCKLKNGFGPLETFLRETELPRHVRSQKSPKRVTNPYEAWLLKLTSISVGHEMTREVRESLSPESAGYLVEHMKKQRHKYQLFHEVALSAFLPLDLGQYSDVKIDWEYARKSRLDILVTGEPPNYTPLMAIEFDGPDHEKPKNKEKDSKKEQILRKANLPLVRITYRDAPEFTNARTSTNTSFAIAVQKEQVLTQLIHRCITVRHFEKIEVPKRFTGYRNKVVDRVNHKIDEFRRQANTLDFPSEKKSEFIAEAFAFFKEDRERVSDDIAVDEYVAMKEREDETDPTKNYPLSRVFRQTGAVLENFQNSLQQDGGISCSAKLIHAGIEQEIRTPTIRFRGIGFQNFDFDKELKQELRIWIIDVAANLLADSETSGHLVGRANYGKDMD